MNIRRVIWFAIVFSTFIYALIAYVMPENQPSSSFDEALQRPMVLPLYAVGVLAFLVAMFVLPRIPFRDAQTAMVAKLAVFESVAIFGLIAVFLAHDWRLYLAPWAVAMLGFLREWPGEAADSRVGV